MDELFLRVQARLTDRDHVLLGWLADHGVLTSFQIAHALYSSLDFAQRRLLKLCQAGLLDRFRPFRAEGGTHPYHYVLGQLGVEIVATHRDEELPRRDQARRRRWHLTTRANLPHLLGVNQFFIELAGYARTHPGTSLDRWWPAARFATRYGFLEEGEPFGLLDRTPKVRPDGHGVFTDGGRRVPFFLEHDTGAEPLHILLDKIGGYDYLARATGRAYPVLFWLHSAVREHHLHLRLTEAGIRYPIATAARDSTAGLSPADAVWRLHRRAGASLPLAELPYTSARKSGTAA
ncbi:replication-relaxation family protein [Actinoplanes sp. NBC_00393]|uniref:replication-relaxation family protein n=1 Tax=Actinoplanes sp. NBC_00393 TaxID=2975953 RepID=UPI002E215097